MGYLKQKPFFSDYSSTYKGSKSMPNDVTLETRKSPNYFKKRRNSGFVEGLNNLIKVAKRRCYGLFKTETIFQRLFLDLQGFEIYA